MSAPALLTAPTVSDTCQAKAERLAYSGAVTVLERFGTVTYGLVRGDSARYFCQVGGVQEFCTCPHVPTESSPSCSHREALRIITGGTDGDD